MMQSILSVGLAIVLVLSLVCTSAADCAKAGTHFREAIALDNTLPSLMRKEQLYRKAIELCPTSAEAHNNLADVYENQGRFDEAVLFYRKAIELQPAAAYPYFGLGDIYLHTNRPREAILWYEKGLKHDQSDDLTRRRLALARDLANGGLVKAETIRSAFSATRGPGEIVSLPFNEGLVPFDYDKHTLRADAHPQLDEIGKALKEMPYTFEIAGHTDIRGADEYNLKLSERRAQSVVAYLTKTFAIPKNRLTAKGYGKRVTLCAADASEACHALNRRVEVVKKDAWPVPQQGRTRSASADGASLRPTDEQRLAMETGFLYEKSDEKQLRVLREDATLHSQRDRYSIFFRPIQECYVYVLQEDAKGVTLLFPRDEKEAFVKAQQDYWVPSFGKFYTLDNTKGTESLYLIATTWQLRPDIEGLSLKQVVQDAARTLKTRSIKVIPKEPTGAQEAIFSNQVTQNPTRINALIETVEGQGGWVRTVRFLHE